MKTSAHQKTALRKGKIKPLTRTKYLQYIYDKRLSYRICKGLWQINYKRTHTNKIIGKDLSSHCTQKRWPISTRTLKSLGLRGMRGKPQIIYISHLLEWLKLNRMTPSNLGKDREELKFSYAAGGNCTEDTYFGKLSGNFSWTNIDPMT